jgi:DNA-binding transcriptional LysR family regulator
MELRHLRYFVAVAEELHFGRAARRLQISQPPLSQQIRRLEEELGVELFRRTKRDVRMTSAGQAFLERARRLLVEVERSVESTRQAARGVVGRLEIGYVPAAEIRVLPRVLRAFRRRFPRVETGLRLLTPAEQVDALRQGRVDVAITRLPLREEGVRVERFLREECRVAVSRRHPLARRAVLGPDDLRGLPLLLFPRAAAPALHDAILGYFRTADGSPKLAYGLHSVGSGLGLVAADLGVSIVPSSFEAMRFPGVAYRRLAPPVPFGEYGLLTLKEAPSPLQLVFLKLVRELFPKTSRA